MKNGENALSRDGTDRDCTTNKSGFADHLLTIKRFVGTRLIDGVKWSVVARTGHEVDAVWDALDEDLPPHLTATPLMRAKRLAPVPRMEMRRMFLHGEAYTYFARGRWTGRIKIGQSRDPWRRVRELLYSNNGEAADLEAVVRGIHFERFYHQVFAAHAHGNEWFLPHPDILAEIERLKALEDGPCVLTPDAPYRTTQAGEGGRA